MSFASRIKRNKAKVEFKIFKKSSPEYKDIRFSDFYKMYKTGLIQMSNTLEQELISSPAEDMEGVSSVELDDIFDEDLLEELVDKDASTD